jgi:predicted DNA-binding transcriptional regulator YafY
MAAEKDDAVKVRALKILKMIVENPFFYTRKQLADKNYVDESTIKRTFENFKSAGFEVLYDENYRYGLAADKPLEHLRELLVFSRKEEEILTAALQNTGLQDPSVVRLLNKMSRVYDVSKMHNVFDKNFLSKMDKLEKAKKDKKVAILREYHSTNSSSISDRTVEPFHISGEDDILHAFDWDRQEIRHFRISRIPKLDISHQDWQHETKHFIQNTDPFRIHKNELVRVHIRIDVGGYNALLEAYPTARGYLKPVPDVADQYDFIAKVNQSFFGLSNFILGNYKSVVAIFEPDDLIDHIQREAETLLRKKF